jgi:hypothetical protein
MASASFWIVDLVIWCAFVFHTDKMPAGSKVCHSSASVVGQLTLARIFIATPVSLEQRYRAAQDHCLIAIEGWEPNDAAGPSVTKSTGCLPQFSLNAACADCQSGLGVAP